MQTNGNNSADLFHDHNFTLFGDLHKSNDNIESDFSVQSTKILKVWLRPKDFGQIFSLIWWFLFSNGMKTDL